MSAKDEELTSAETPKGVEAESAKAAEGMDVTAEGTAKNTCCGDGTTWTNAADKAQDELDQTGTVNQAESDDMKKHSAA